MPQTVSSIDRLTRAQENCTRLVLLVQEVITNPTQANIDAIVLAADGTGSLVPQPQYSLDGESYDWPGYIDKLLAQIEQTQKLIVLLGGPFLIRTRGTT